MLLVKPTYWTDWNARSARLAFIEDIRAIVSPGKQLFSAPEFDLTDAKIFAYRLGREIARKPLLCASPDDYFLLRSDSTNVPGVETQVLASSTSDGVSLVAVIRKPFGRTRLHQVIVPVTHQWRPFMPNLAESTRSREEVLSKVTVIAPICSLFDSDLYRQAEAFLLIDMFTTLVL